MTAEILMLLESGYADGAMARWRTLHELAYIGALEEAQTGGSKDDYYRIIRNAINRSLDIYLKAIKGETEGESLDDDSLLKIGQLAKAAGETPPTIRHWVKTGLISIADVTPSGYQMFSKDMIGRAQKIRELQAKRFTLAEIKDKLT